MKNYIFDFDGTLINSSEEVLFCFKQAFQRADIDIDETRFTSDVIGPPLKQILELLAPEIIEDKLKEKILNYYSDVYDNSDVDMTTVYDGVFSMLDALKSSGCRLFMATYKPMKPTLRLVEKFDFNMFEDIYTIDKFGENITKKQMIEDIVEKYSLEKSETVMIGDAPSDVISARQAGVKSVGVLWGYGSDKSKLIENSDVVIERVDELLNI